MLRIVTRFFYLLLVLQLFLVAHSVLSEVNSHHRFMPPPGRLVDVGTHKLHLNCYGEGGPTVIADSGLGSFSLDWVLIQELVRQDVKLCAYDRAGYGWSDAGPAPRTTDRIVDELHTLLFNAGLPPPYILIGHSFGGYNMQYFAKSYPDETAGLILVDSSHPDQAERLPELPVIRENTRMSNIVPIFTSLSMYDLFPEYVREQLLHLMTLRKSYNTQLREFRNITTSGRQVANSGRLPAVPLIVISRGQRNWPDTPYGNSLEYEWRAMQHELALQIPRGRQIIAINSGHQIHLEQPVVVSTAILTMVKEIRNQYVDTLNIEALEKYSVIGG